MDNLWDAGWWLNPIPLNNMSSSIGMIIANMWKNVPSHRTDIGKAWLFQCAVCLCLAWGNPSADLIATFTSAHLRPVMG